MSTILIVEDDFDVRDSLADILEDEGFSVATANDGEDALAYLRANPRPSLILLDWMMPRCNGAQFRVEQKSDPALADIPVVLLTADARIEEKQNGIDAADFVAKPVKLERLLAIVRRFAR